MHHPVFDGVFLQSEHMHVKKKNNESSCIRNPVKTVGRFLNARV